MAKGQPARQTQDKGLGEEISRGCSICQEPKPGQAESGAQNSEADLKGETSASNPDLAVVWDIQAHSSCGGKDHCLGPLEQATCLNLRINYGHP